MGRQDRTDFYRSNRDYGNLLHDKEGEFDEEEDPPVTQQEEQELDEDLSHECQEYLRRRERLKELERQKLRQANGLKEFEKQKFRQANGNGRSLTASTKKQLPFDNYGSFFGPSEPVVARRVIEARAKEEADRLARLAKTEVGMTKSSGASKSKDEPRTSDAGKQFKPVNEAALRLQQLKEARDYSFLFTDEDPTKTPPRSDASAASETRKQNHDRKKSLDIEKGSTIKAQKSSSLMKPSSSIKSTKPNVVMASQKSQERQTTSIMKPSKYPEKPAVTKSKHVAHAESSHASRNLSSSHINSSKTISGPGRPSIESSSAKKSSTSAMTAQLKNLVASGPKISPKIPPKQQQPSNKLVPGNGAAAKHQLPTNKPMSGKGPPSKPVVDNKKHSLNVQPDRKPSAVILPGRAGSGHADVKRPLHPESSKQIKPPSKPIRPPANPVRKRPGDFESDDSFLDDEDDLEGEDVSSMIRRMFGYNPNKYRHIDDEDDRAMEADYRTIQREERRSAKIAREEDEREEVLLLEEERRERERKKRRKLQQR